MTVTQTPAVIVETIAIKAPIETVFAALTVPERVLQWWGSEDTYRVTAMEADVRPGGAWKSSGIGREGQPFTVSGVYRAVEPPTLVEFTWNHDWSEDSGLTETLVRYELSETDGVTNLTVRHSGFAVQSERDGHARGWTGVLAWVRDYVESRG